MKLTHLIILIFISGTVFSQDTLKSRFLHVSRVNISYFGESALHYGLKLGAENSLWIKDKVKTKRNNKESLKRKELILTANLGGYFHKHNHIGLFINSEIGYRKTQKKGFKSEIFLGLGYLHTILQGDTYTVNDDSTVDQLHFAGQSNLMIPLTFGFGYDFDYFYNKPFSIHIKPGFFIQYPYNIQIAIRSTLELGIIYKL